MFNLILAFLPLAACGNGHDIKSRIDGEWYRRNLEIAHLALG